MRYLLFLFSLVFSVSTSLANPTYQWISDNQFLSIVNGEIIQHTLPSGENVVVVSSKQLQTATGMLTAQVEDFSLSTDKTQILVFTNGVKVWRYKTKGEYWLVNIKTGSIKEVGMMFPPQSLQFAKLSPSGTKIAYVYNKNIYVDDLASNTTKQLTSDGKHKVVNGTFDWVYEEEFNCRDGFRWSPDSKFIAYWQADATHIPNYSLVNLTDSLYPQIKAVEYPKIGQPISAVRIGVVGIGVPEVKTKWLSIPGEADANYLVRMEWTPKTNEIIVQQLNRKQQETSLFICNPTTGNAKLTYVDYDSAWVDIQSSWDSDYNNGGWDWINEGNQFLWASEKDGWRHIYKVDRLGKEHLITTGDFDVMDLVHLDETNEFLYYMASPGNATRKYLYRSRLDGSGKPERITPASQPGTHSYHFSPTATFAFHEFSNITTPPIGEWITLNDHKGIKNPDAIEKAIRESKKTNVPEFFTIKTVDGISMDGWMQKPANFDKTKKYPVLFYVYSEPAAQTVKDEYYINYNPLYNGDLAADGYIYISVDNRGTPAPKGREWRKSIYRNIGIVNIRDQAMAAQEILKWGFIDAARVAVWGWSGGGSATLNLMFQYPNIYKTGISIAAVASQLTYDNAYQERYMGQLNETKADYIKGSPITYAKNLKGNLLYIHGTGDDNVHYQNAELLINELIKNNKQFQFMSYPNRSHSIDEGEGTRQHLSTLYTKFLKENCKPGGE
jgi:dipeptidyl-peptidase-4